MAIERILLIHHSHTDIGYTHDQPILWELEQRFLDTALDLCEQGDDQADDAQRWTVETTAPLLHWLRSAPESQVERLRRLERAGRIEVTGMWANLTPLVDTAQFIRSLEPLAELRERHGLTIRHAMNCDVNGHNWPVVESLLDAGIEGFSMAINEHFGGAPLDRPNVFLWEGVSGRRIAAFNGWHYMYGNMLGIPHDPDGFAQRWADIEQRLQTRGWPLPAIAVQLTHAFGDNGSVDPRLPEFVRGWNASGRTPHLRLALPRDWWAEVRASRDRLPVYRGDWTDYWNFGAISSARETTMNRQSRTRLRVAGAFSCLPPAAGGDPAPGAAEAVRRRPAMRAEAWQALTLWDEHTWGADNSIRDPENEDVSAQWNHKAHEAYVARSLSQLLQRDAVAELARRVPRAEDDQFLVFNPSPWERSLGGVVPERVMSRRGLADDLTSARQSVDRQGGPSRRWLPPVAVPGLGWRVVSTSELGDAAPQSTSETAVVDNGRYRLVLDRERGGVRSWQDLTLGRQWVDARAPWTLGALVHEEVADHTHPWPRNLLFGRPGGEPGHRGWQVNWRALRRSAQVRGHRVLRLPGGWRVEQDLDLPGVDDARLVLWLEDGSGRLEVQASWSMRRTAHPEATYLVLPLDVPEATARLDVGGVPVRPGLDQIPGCCRDYFTVQRWVDFSGPSGGVGVGTPDNALLQLGGFRFGEAQTDFTLGASWLVGWVTNNYWETNFRARQEGRVTARYVLEPHAGDFEESRAHRLGEEASSPAVFMPAWEPTLPRPDLPRVGGLLRLPEPPVLVLELEPVAGGALVRLQNASDGPSHAVLGPGAVCPSGAWATDLFGQLGAALAREGEGFGLDLAPRAVATVRLAF